MGREEGRERDLASPQIDLEIFLNLLLIHKKDEFDCRWSLLSHGTPEKRGESDTLGALNPIY